MTGRNPKETLKAKEFLAHLRRHPLPELMDEACMDALKNVEAQLGDTDSSMEGLEVRLGDEARYVDYILNREVEDVPLIKGEWVEIDYEQFASGGPIEACYFASLGDGNTRYDEIFLDKTLPIYAGEETAKRLRPMLERIFSAMPDEVIVKQVGVMTSRGADAGLRLVLSYPSLQMLADNLVDFEWPGDRAALMAAFAPWEKDYHFALALDVWEDHVGEKIGLETYWEGKNPANAERAIDLLEAKGLALPSKAKGVRRWIHFAPDGNPMLQTWFVYFKLNYLGGRIYEAKAYLEATPKYVHCFFPAYDRPLRLDMELAGASGKMPLDDALARVAECAAEHVVTVRLYGGENFEGVERVMAACRDASMETEIVIRRPLSREWLQSVVKEKPKEIFVELRGDGAEAKSTLETLRDLGVGGDNMDGPGIHVVWPFVAGEEDRLSDLLAMTEPLGAKEFIITHRPAEREASEGRISREDFDALVETVWSHRMRDVDMETTHMMTVADTCFSELLAAIGEKILPGGNFNEGQEKGCMAGRSAMALRADGRFAPCLFIEAEDGPTSLGAYWEKTKTMQALRKDEPRRESCPGCSFRDYCRPCAGRGGRVLKRSPQYVRFFVEKKENSIRLSNK